MYESNAVSEVGDEVCDLDVASFELVIEPDNGYEWLGNVTVKDGERLPFAECLLLDLDPVVRMASVVAYSLCLLPNPTSTETYQDCSSTAISVAAHFL